MPTRADGRIAIRINKKMIKHIKNQALKENRNVSEIIRQIIHEYLKKEKNDTK